MTKQTETRRAAAAQGVNVPDKVAAGGSARLRHAIDTGRTRDKVPGLDPAAAPLGTDDESAGTRPPLGAETTPAGNPASPAMAADTSGTPRGIYRVQDRIIWPVILLGIVVIAVLVVGAAWLTR